MITCTAIATFIDWKVDGQPVDDHNRQDFDDSTRTVSLNTAQNLRMSELKVMGSPTSNGSSIACVVALEIDTNIFVGNSSEPAMIHVQGNVV